MKTIIFALIIIFTFIGRAHSVAGIDASSLKAGWTGNGISCQDGNLNNASVGTVKNICKGKSSEANADTSHMDSNCRTGIGDDYGTMMFVAREINANGAKFCATTIHGESAKKKHGWTRYGEPAQGEKCFWMCKDGYSGDSCAGQNDGSVCDSKSISRDDFNGLSMARGINVESSIAMFESRSACDDSEVDMVLAITDWVDNGVIAQAVLVRSNDKAWKSGGEADDAYVMVSGIEPKHTLCQTGYKADGNKCVAINQNVCDANSICAAWTGYDAAIHELKYNGSCFEFRCKEAGKGFDASRKCVDCGGSSPKNGINPSNGECVKCATGKKFDEGAASSNYCAGTTAYSTSDLVYGVGKKTEKMELHDQCWTKILPSEYECCVLGKTWNSATSECR